MNTAPLSPDPYRRFGAGDGYAFGIRNYWVRVFLAIWRKMSCLFTCTPEAGADIETVAVDVPQDVAIELRSSRQYARKTVVSNISDVRIDVYEGGALVAIVGARKSKVLPRTGKLALAGQAQGSGAQLIVTTFIRCACGDDYEQSADSIGAHLL